MSKIPFEPIERSVYLGRAKLGRYCQVSVKIFEAFDATDVCLGAFSSANEARAAIDAAFETAVLR
jgi:hypothetical protein